MPPTGGPVLRVELRALGCAESAVAAFPFFFGGIVDANSTKLSIREPVVYIPQ